MAGGCPTRGTGAPAYPVVVTDQPGPTDSAADRPTGSSAAPRDVFRDLAALVCAVQALSLLGFVAFYLWELTQGASKDAVLVVMSALLILVFAIGIGALARGWWKGANWPNTPTIVWNLLLLPAAWSLFQAGRGVVALALAVVAALGIVSAARADTADRDDATEGGELGGASKG